VELYVSDRFSPLEFQIDLDYVTFIFTGNTSLGERNMNKLPVFYILVSTEVKVKHRFGHTLSLTSFVTN